MKNKNKKKKKKKKKNVYLYQCRWRFCVVVVVVGLMVVSVLLLLFCSFVSLALFIGTKKLLSFDVIYSWECKGKRKLIGDLCEGFQWCV